MAIRKTHKNGFPGFTLCGIDLSETDLGPDKHGARLVKRKPTCKICLKAWEHSKVDQEINKVLSTREALDAVYGG